MDSSIISVSELLNSGKNFTSAGFSAGYNFDENKAGKYFDELLMSSPSHPIFSGILIIQKSGENYTIIDGLQRLTTISLLLCALCESYKGTSNKNETARDKVFSRFLINPQVQNEPKLKINPNEHKIYKKILFSKDLNEDEKNNALYKTFNTFLNKINEHKISGTELFKIISKIQFMTVITDKSEISVRDLYQALNEIKKEPQINLISDFIKQHDKFSMLIWQKLVHQFKDSNLPSKNLLEAFIKDFLITRTDQDIPNEEAMYNNFKNYFHKISQYQDSKTILENMYKYSQYYLQIINSDFENPEIKEQIELLNKNGGKDTYPYLMEVLDDLENSHIDTGAFLNILMMINLFIKSRKDSSFQGINIDFSNLSRELNKMLVLKDYVPEAIEDDKLTINIINNLSSFEV